MELYVIVKEDGTKFWYWSEHGAKLAAEKSGDRYRKATMKEFLEDLHNAETD